VREEFGDSTGIVGTLSTTCTLVDLDFSKLCSFIHGFIVLLSTLVFASWIRVVIVSISVVLRLSTTFVCSLLPGCVLVVGGDSPIYPL
jgi:hypothetical protein